MTSTQLTINQLVDKVTQAEDKYSKLKAELNQLNAEITNLPLEIEKCDFELKYNILQDEYSRLKKSYNELNSMKIILEDKVKASKSACNEVNNNLINIDQEIKLLEESLAKTIGRIRNLDHEISVKEDENDKISPQKLNDAQLELAAMVARLDEIRKVKSTYQKTKIFEIVYRYSLLKFNLAKYIRLSIGIFITFLLVIMLFNNGNSLYSLAGITQKLGATQLPSNLYFRAALNGNQKAYDLYVQIPENQYKLAQKFITDGDIKKGESLLISAAQNNIEPAQYLLYQLMNNNQIISSNQQESAQYWLQKSAYNGNLVAQHLYADNNANKLFEIAQLYQKGTLGINNMDQADGWYIQAALLGNKYAEVAYTQNQANKEFALAKIYYDHNEINNALKLFNLAARSGNTDAQAWLNKNEPKEVVSIEPSSRLTSITPAQPIASNTSFWSKVVHFLKLAGIVVLILIAIIIVWFCFAEDAVKLGVFFIFVFSSIGGVTFYFMSGAKKIASAPSTNHQQHRKHYAKRHISRSEIANLTSPEDSINEINTRYRDYKLSQITADNYSNFINQQITDSTKLITYYYQQVLSTCDDNNRQILIQKERDWVTFKEAHTSDANLDNLAQRTIEGLMLAQRAGDLSNLNGVCNPIQNTPELDSYSNTYSDLTQFVYQQN